MAKSLRSKRKRMLRNIKRKRYAVKEMKRLKDMLGIATNSDVEMKLGDTAEVCAVPDSTVESASAVLESEIKHHNKEPPKSVELDANGEIVCPSDSSDDEPPELVPSLNSTKTEELEMDHSDKKRYNKKTMKDQHGNYPPWFNSKDIKRHRKKEKLRKKIEKKLERSRAKLKKVKISKKSQKSLKKKNKEEGEGNEVEIIDP